MKPQADSHAEHLEFEEYLDSIEERDLHHQRLVRSFVKLCGLGLAAGFGAAAYYKIASYDPLHGTEKMDSPVPFNQIEQQGDPRIKRVISLMRKSTEGEKLYQYASQNGLLFSWENQSGRGGGYSENVVLSKTHKSDEEVSFIIAHEIAHGQQDKITQPDEKRINGPQLTAQIYTTLEIGACAYAAHYAAKWKDQTGKPLKVAKGFGAAVANSYANIPAAQRNYLTDAVFPCAEDFKNYLYTWRHLLLASSVLARGKSVSGETSLSARLAEIKLSPYERPKDFDVFADDLQGPEKAVLMSRLLTPFMEQKDIPEDLRPSENDYHLALGLAEGLAFSEQRYEQELNRLQSEFDTYRSKALEADKNAQNYVKNQRIPASRPSSHAANP